MKFTRGQRIKSTNYGETGTVLGPEDYDDYVDSKKLLTDWELVKWDKGGNTWINWIWMEPVDES